MRPDFLEHVAARIRSDPAAVAVRHGSRSLTYLELDRASRVVGARLVDMGVGPDSRVGLVAERSLETMVGVLAVLRAGGAYVPLDPAYPQERLVYMLRDSRAEILLSARERPDSLEADVRFVQLPGVEQLLREEPGALATAFTGDHLAYVIYTSGSTGRPKGVAMVRRALSNLIDWQLGSSQSGVEDRTLQFASLSFDVSFQEIFATWGAGGTLVLLDESVRTDPLSLARFVDEQRIARLFLPFVALQQLAEAANYLGIHPGSLREVLVAGEQLRITTGVREFFGRLQGCRLENQYGPAESHVVTFHRLAPDPVAWPVLPPIGRALPGTHVLILDPSGQTAPSGVVGEIHIGGIALARGYLDRPDLTDERFILRPGAPAGDSRLYRTGDLGLIRPDGEIAFVGRADDQIKIRGVRVEPGEVEDALEAHPSVEAAAVIAREDAAGSLMLAAYFVAGVGEVSAGELRAFLGDRLPPAMVPSRFVRIESLPLTPSGKIDRRALAGRSSIDAPAAVPSTDLRALEARVAEVWARNLDLPSVPLNESFFELGGTSVLTLRVAIQLSEALATEVPVTALFEYPTVASLAAHLREVDPAAHLEPQLRRSGSGDHGPIAIIGMDCRLPGAANIDEFWTNLLAGVDGISHFGREELLAEGTEPEALDDPDFVSARGLIEGADLFDAGFFGYPPREASLMDPQHRLFLESCWNALESAGYPPDGMKVPVGVWGGMSTGMGYTTYLVSNLASGEGIRPSDRLQVMLGNANDYLTTRVSYKLNLRGPSINVQTACSTSLVAVCQAVGSLRRGDCEFALAGGVSVSFPQKAGYLHQEGGIESSDGRCRPFDQDAEGTVFSDGVSTVVLRRLEDAIRDGDPIHAVIHGVGLNNDGAEKVSFSAPSVAGQALAIQAAQVEAGFSPESIQYVEAHGTATQLGDPIEVAALVRAFRAGTNKSGFCAIGSVKSNIGHTVAAAGTAALIKTTLALRNGVIPASLHFERPNERIDFPSSPFFVASERLPWPEGDAPKRAGVSSFGLGGTNAHVVLQEAPPIQAGGPGRTWDIALLSGRWEGAPGEAGRRLASHLETHPETDWADAAHTTRVGRSAMRHRWAVVARGRADAIGRLGKTEDALVVRGVAPDSPPLIAFMFPGGGAQYPGMARDLYGTEEVFRRAIDHCAERLNPDIDLVAFIEAEDATGEMARKFERPGIALPTLFSVEYALAELWTSWGVVPGALIGHSMGEYTAAVIAGVMSLDDALSLVVTRGRLFDTLPDGSMTAVPLSEDELRVHLTSGLSVGVINGPDSCVASGPTDEIEALEQLLDSLDVECRRVHIAVAAHSAMVEPILEEFGSAVAAMELRPPTIPCGSNVTGTWLTAEEAVSPEYWVRQLRQTVRFSDGLESLAQSGAIALVEVGPGNTLGSLARLHPSISRGSPVVASLRHPREETEDGAFLLRSLGQLWVGGVDVRWDQFVEGQGRRRVPLPTYPFQRESHLIQPGPQSVLPTIPAAGFGAIGAGDDLALWLGSLQAAAPPTNQVQQSSSRSTTVSRRDRILHKLKDVVHGLSGIAPEELDADVAFLDMGFDSLFLTQASLGFKREFGVRVTFRQLFEDAPNLAALAEYIDGALGPDVEVEGPPSAAPAVPAASVASSLPVLPASFQMPSGTAGQSAIHQVLALHLQSTAALLSLMGGATTVPPSLTQPGPGATPNAPIAPQNEGQAVSEGAGTAATAEAPETAPAPRSGPYRALNRERVSGLTERQAAFIAEFSERYIGRTHSSKELTQAHRDVFADPRAVAGFRKDWKEIVYPIAVDRSKGSRMWDVDGNEYIDVVSGFGAIFFGHAPDFVVEAVAEQLHHSLDYGPQSMIAGEIARMVCDATGMDRASFCNTGSEAVLAAMRTARTATGQDTIVTFNGDYHGIFDEVLVSRQVFGSSTRNVPIAPGIPRSASQNMVVLDYGDPASLERIRELGPELAGVLVEPVQSRTPEFQPREFLHALRKLCTEIEVPLIFDEIITGFRIHPRGAQGWFGVQADIAAYGKVIGGGMPIGVVAGKKLYLDALDGGGWQFGDDSFPEAGVTYFAGTFIRHPLSLTAVHTVLKHLKAHGSELQDQANERTARLVIELNEYFESRRIPIEMVHCGSVFLSRFGGKPEFDPIFHRLLHFHGLHIWEGRPGFLTTAHSEEDIDRMIESFKRAATEMVEGGLLEQGAPAEEAAAEAARGIALTEPQTELWLAAAMGDAGARAFNEPVRLDLRGRLHLPALRRAVRKVVERHESLRTTVREDAPGLVIHATMNVPLPFVDLSAAGVEDRARELEEQLYEQGSSAFDLVKGPLIRFQLVRLEEDYHALLMTVHHIACDGWSIEIALRDLAAIYNAAVTGRRLTLPTAMQLTEYNEQYTERQTSSEVAEMEVFWTGQFRPVPPPLDLPWDRPRPPIKTYNGARHALTVEGNVGEGLKRVSAEQGCTLFTTLLAAFNVLMQKLSGEEDVVVGVPAAGQALLGENTLVAHCVSFLPVRSAVTSSRTFTSYLGELRGLLLDANDNQEYTYGSLVEKLGLPRDPSRVPLLSASFNLDPAITGLEFHGLAWTYVPVPRSFSKLDIDLNVIATDGELLLEIDHNTDLIDRETALRWMAHYSSLLRAIVENPDRPIGDLELVSIEEQGHLIGGESQLPIDSLPAMRVEELFEARAKATPSAPAISCGDRHVTYDELNTLADRIAGHIRGLAHGGAERLIGVLLDRTPEMLATLLGIWKAGATYVPLDPDFPVARLQRIVADAGLSAVIATEDRSSLLTAGERILLLEDLVASDPPRSAGESAAVDPDGLAYVIYTSGSTGEPKGVEIPHTAVVNFLSSMALRPGMSSSDSLLAVTTISFDISVLELFLPLSVGGQVILATQEISQDGVALAALIASARPTLMQATPTHWQLLLEAGWPGQEGLKLLSGGEALPDALAQRLTGCGKELWNMYGPTETTIWSTCQRIEAGPVTGPVGVRIGRPIANTQAYVLDPAMRPVAPGVSGELYLGGSGLARGYRNRADLTARCFVEYPHSSAPGRLYRTGDVVRYRADGELEFVGRSDRQVKVRGFRLELGDVEAAAEAFAGVSRAVSTVRRLSEGDARLVVYFVAQGSVDTSELRAHIRNALPEYMVPQAFVQMETFPLTANGKIDVNALPDPFNQPAQEAAANGSPWASATEAHVGALWQETLAVSGFGRMENFFDLGGHSVLATRVVGRLRSDLAPSLSLRDLFRYPTVADLSAHIDDLRSEASTIGAVTAENEEFVF